jgi:hypothetical protein
VGREGRRREGGRGGERKGKGGEGRGRERGREGRGGKEIGQNGREGASPQIKFYHYTTDTRAFYSTTSTSAQVLGCLGACQRVD